MDTDKITIKYKGTSDDDGVLIEVRIKHDDGESFISKVLTLEDPTLDISEEEL